MLEFFNFQSAICGGEGKKGDSGNGKHEKMKQCIDETQQLKECCPYPVDESTECKSHLDGVEDKKGKEKHEAFSCYFECKFDMKGLITDGALNKEKIHIEAADYLKGTDFTEISTSSIDYCYDECKFLTKYSLTTLNKRAFYVLNSGQKNGKWQSGKERQERRRWQEKV